MEIFLPKLWGILVRVAVLFNMCRRNTVYFHKLHRSGRILLSLRLSPELPLPPMERRCWESAPAAVFCLGQATLRPLWYLFLPIYHSACFLSCLCHCAPLAAITQKSAWGKRCTWPDGYGFYQTIRDSLRQLCMPLLAPALDSDHNGHCPLAVFRHKKIPRSSRDFF